MNYEMKAHKVEIYKIVKLQPLLGRGGSSLMSPDLGLELELDEGRKVKWLAESEQPVPTAGDYYVEDSVLGISVLVPAAKFAEIFSGVSA